MKTPLFFIAALVAFFLLPLDFITAVSLLFAAALGAIVISEYRRSYEFITPRTAGAKLSRQNLRLAA